MLIIILFFTVYSRFTFRDQSCEWNESNLEDNLQDILRSATAVRKCVQVRTVLQYYAHFLCCLLLFNTLWACINTLWACINYERPVFMTDSIIICAKVVCTFWTYPRRRTTTSSANGHPGKILLTPTFVSWTCHQHIRDILSAFYTKTLSFEFFCYLAKWKR